ncbi:MAG: hypothetical protein HGB32_14560 [Geobacteraceae bacterium]|nr:hypothetical protein [Geobacteraceae bacterium]NTW81347.1 hypothetical protein [Geobacteraceae bacterium]
MKIFCIFIVSAIFFGSYSICSANQAHVGIVKSAVGEVMVLRNNLAIKAETNAKLLEGDLIQTGPNGKVGLIFEDDAVISMGPNTKIVIEKFMFQPAEKKMSFIARIIQGTASFLSGQLVKLAPDLVRIETPYATVGMRGTHVLIKVD